MKKTAIILIIALALALATFALSLTGCDDKDDDTHTHEWEWKVTTPATQTADGLETETCKTCGATNGTRTIAMLPVGYITEYQTNVQIPIYQKTNVTDEQAETAVNNIISGYDKITPNEKNQLAGKLAEIWIVATVVEDDGYRYFDYEITADNRIIAKFKYDHNVTNMQYNFEDIASYIVPKL